MQNETISKAQMSTNVLCEVTGPEADIEDSLKGLEVYFCCEGRLGPGKHPCAFFCIDFSKDGLVGVAGHTGLALAMWKGGCGGLAIVTFFVVGISCGSVIVGQIEVIAHPPHPSTVR